MKGISKIFTAVILAAAFPAVSFCATLTAVQITYTLNFEVKSRNIYCSGKVPGEMTKGKFASFASKIKKIKTSGIGKKKLPLFRALKSAGSPACQSIPSATPTPTPAPAPGNFDSNGNVSAQGKALFGIPSELSGNISEGRTFYLLQCNGCHGDKLNKTFSQLRSAISASPMFFDTSQVPDPDLADVTAYVNRFRQ